MTAERIAERKKLLAEGGSLADLYDGLEEALYAVEDLTRDNERLQLRVEKLRRLLAEAVPSIDLGRLPPPNWNCRVRAALEVPHDR